MGYVFGTVADPVRLPIPVRMADEDRRSLMRVLSYD